MLASICRLPLPSRSLKAMLACSVQQRWASQVHSPPPLAPSTHMAMASDPANPGASTLSVSAGSGVLSAYERVWSREERVFRHILTHAKEGDPASILAIANEYNATESLMDVGASKGKVLTNLCLQKKANTVVELGGYYGYSAILFAAALQHLHGRHQSTSLAPPQVYSIEFDPLFAAIATKLAEFAGVRHLVTVLIGTATYHVPRLLASGALTHVDLLFMDHAKGAYTSDLQLFEQNGLLRSGSLVLADNVLLYDTAEYLTHVRSDPNKYRTYTQQFQMSKYGRRFVDGIEVTELV